MSSSQNYHSDIAEVVELSQLQTLLDNSSLDNDSVVTNITTVFPEDGVDSVDMGENYLWYLKRRESILLTNYSLRVSKTDSHLYFPTSFPPLKTLPPIFFQEVGELRN